MVLPSGELHIRDVSPEDGYKSYRCRTKHRLTGETRLSATAGRLVVTGEFPEQSGEKNNNKFINFNVNRLRISHKLRQTKLNGVKVLLAKSWVEKLLPTLMKGRDTPST